jgi:galactokinase
LCVGVHGLRYPRLAGPWLTLCTLSTPSAAPSLRDQAWQGFGDAYGGPPTGVWSAPGRVNLIGEHTDYNDGLVLPFAINRRTAVAAATTATGRLRAVSSFSAEVLDVHLGSVGPHGPGGWGAYVSGVAWAVAGGRAPVDAPGVDMFICSDVPVGAGLSSSAALESAAAGALDELWRLGLDRTALALAGRRAENEVVGAPTGIMDQFASLFGQEGAVLFLDCRTRAHRPVPFPLARDAFAVLVIDTRESHAHATGGYAARRASCQKAVATLGLAALRDLELEELEAARPVLDDETFRRARHVVTEDQRVARTVAVLEADGPAAIGELLNQSHRSMRDDFEISTPALDLACRSALAGGAIGARMTGGGFGGSAIALAPVPALATVEAEVTKAFAAAGRPSPALYEVLPSGGAGREDDR